MPLRAREMIGEFVCLPLVRHTSNRVLIHIVIFVRVAVPSRSYFVGLSNKYIVLFAMAVEVQRKAARCRFWPNHNPMMLVS